MKSIYNMSRQVVACILLLSLFLQSCAFNMHEFMLRDISSSNKTREHTVKSTDQANVGAQSRMEVLAFIDNQPQQQADLIQNPTLTNIDNLVDNFELMDITSSNNIREYTVESSNQANLGAQSMTGVSPDRAVVSVETEDKSIRKNLSKEKVSANKSNTKSLTKKRATTDKSTIKESSTNYQERSQLEQAANVSLSVNYSDEISSDKTQENTKRLKRNNGKKSRKSVIDNQVSTRKRKNYETEQGKQQPASIGSAEDDIDEIGVSDKSQERDEQSRKEAAEMLEQLNSIDQPVMDLLNLRGNSLNQTDRMANRRSKNLHFGPKTELIHTSEGTVFATIDEAAMLYYIEGMKFYEKQDYIKAKEAFKKAAKRKNTKAQNMMGILYYHGQGVNKNYTRAKKWHQIAALQGDLEAQDHLNHINSVIEISNLEYST